MLYIALLSLGLNAFQAYLAHRTQTHTSRLLLAKNLAEATKASPEKGGPVTVDRSMFGFTDPVETD